MDDEREIPKVKIIILGFLSLGFLILATFYLVPMLTGEKRPFDFLLTDCDERPPLASRCITYNIDNNDCVEEGHTGRGFLGLKDYDTEYYVCKDLGRVARKCIEWSVRGPSNLTSDYNHCKEGTGW